MRDAVALTQRVELQSPEGTKRVVAGFRADGCLSLYFGDDPYYQFDSLGRLRRALVDGRLFRTQGSGLAALTRANEADASVLVRHDLDPAELESFLAAMLRQVGSLLEALGNGSLQAVRQVPPEAPIVGRILERIEAILNADGELAPAINRMR